MFQNIFIRKNTKLLYSLKIHPGSDFISCLKWPFQVFLWAEIHGTLKRMAGRKMTSAQDKNSTGIGNCCLQKGLFLHLTLHNCAFPDFRESIWPKISKNEEIIVYMFEFKYALHYMFHKIYCHIYFLFFLIFCHPFVRN